MLKNNPKLRFNNFHGNWETKVISEVSKLGRGVSKNRPRDASHLYGGTYPFIQTGDIRNSDLYIHEFRQTYSDAGLKQSKLWEEDTLCVTIAANIAETAILKIKACFPDSVIGIIPIENKTTSLFLKYQFENFKTMIKKMSQGVAQENLNLEKLSSITFNFPSLHEQQKIASFLSTVDEKINLLKKQLTLLEQYKKGVMQKIFSREIRFKDEDGKEFPEWEEKKLGEVCKISKGVQLNKEFLTITGEYPCINGGINPSGFTNNFNTPKNTITISEGGNSCGFVNLIKVDFWCGGHCYSMLNLEQSISMEYLFQILKYNEVNIMSLRVGSGLPNIQKKDLDCFLISQPTLQEQSKIASFLSEIDEKIDKNKDQIRKMESWKKGLLQQMFI